ncbi:phosphate acetyltransferase [Fusibacter tunisiensis]|uniref:Phosphate acetyltransferase n=1 Tax=Fusibacter tunisiensis TaxID=1008308 RepID=A0ABS2MS89_9FIRM|nr:phosphate acetyltransferase [Fusibacter tunisiensis]MBM7562288.1 phosphate acetyltransferase [Fusibacter tunisiensis]
MAFLDKVIEIAKKDVQTIVLPEAFDPRTIEATHKILEQGIADVILVGNKTEILSGSGEWNIENATFINPETFEELDAYAAALAELRKSKGMTQEEARKLLLENALYFGVMLVKMGRAGGMVAGAANSTANVLRPALQILKTAPGTKLVSAVFLMEVPNCDLGEEGIFIFGDCALNPNPTSEELAHIAISSAKTFESLVHKEAKVAMLSFSSKGSAAHPDVDKVIEAGKIAQNLAPDLQLDAELQLDAAIVPKVGKSKAPESKVAGQANVIIFPDLDAGNIGYKLVQRLAGANAYGPVCQGLSMPVNDLSRGCYADDIVGTVALTALQAQMQSK